MGPAARLDEAKQQFKALKEKAEHYVTADGKKIGGVPRESGNIFNFLNKLLKHEMARAGAYLMRNRISEHPLDLRKRWCCHILTIHSKSRLLHQKLVVGSITSVTSR